MLGGRSCVRHLAKLNGFTGLVPVQLALDRSVMMLLFNSLMEGWQLSPAYAQHPESNPVYPVYRDF
jgi:hypothetical protein